MAHTLVDLSLCKNDGACAVVCPIGLLEVGREGRGPQAASNAAGLCLACGHCVSVCPTGALSLEALPRSALSPIRAELQPSPEQADQLLRGRRSIRAYQERSVPRELLEALIATASTAPSGHNRQPVRWTVVSGRDAVGALAGRVIDWMRRLDQAGHPMAASLGVKRLLAGWDQGQDPILRRAPHVILAHAPAADMAARGACPIAVTYLQLAAAARGLGSCWAGFLMIACGADPSCARDLGLPEGEQIHGATMLGYSRHVYVSIPPRKPPEIRWQGRE